MLEKTEIELVAQAINGSRPAFQALVEHNYMFVYKLSYKFTGSREDAEDVTQDVFTKLGGSISRFKGESTFKTWLYTITSNTAKDYFRKHKSRLKQVAFEDSPDIVSADENQEDSLYKKQIIKAVGRLPEKLKQAIILVYSEGLTHAEAAKILNCSEGTISWRVHEARKLLLNIKEKIKLFISWLF